MIMAIRDHINVVHDLLALCIEDIENICQVIKSAVDNANKILLIGNGGSAADCQHIAADLMNGINRTSSPVPAIALTTDTSIITSISNDRDFDYVFSNQINALASPGDVVIGISTSGKSENVRLGIIEADKINCLTAGLLGCDGGTINSEVGCSVVVPSHSTQRIQECHILIGHLICEYLEANNG